MQNEKKIWLIEQYAHKAWAVSLVLAQEAARAGQHGKGYAVVAHEARILADKLFEYTAKARFDGDDKEILKDVVNASNELKFLSVNAMLENIHVSKIHMDYNIPKSMSVFVEEMRRIAIGLNELTGENNWQKPFTMPELAQPSKSAAVDSFFLFSIGGHPLIESMKNIQEIAYSPKNDIEGKMLSLRGAKIPLIHCYRRFDIPTTNFDPNRQTVMVIHPDGLNMEHGAERYAVPIDELDINAIFYSHVGCAVSPKKEHLFVDYARECWDTVDGGQFIFANWKKLYLE